MEREGIPPDVITYNSLLKAAAARGLLGEAKQLYGELKGAGLAPSTFTYAALFSAAARAQARDAAWLLEVRRAGCLPQCVPAAARALRVLTALALHGGPAPWCCRLPLNSGGALPLLLAVQVFDEMGQLGVQPNNHVVSALFAAASFAPCNHEQLDRLFAALALLRRWAAA